MGNNTRKIIQYIEYFGFERDIEDNVWYSKDYKRISIGYYSKHCYHVFYPTASFSDGIIFTHLSELTELIRKFFKNKFVD